MSTAEFLEIIANMEVELARLKAALGVEGVVIKAAPVKEKKEPNVWIKFSQRVSTLLKEADIKTGAATVSKQFASSLKDEKGYNWTDEAILAAWKKWTKPAESKMAAAKREASGDEGSVKSAKASKAEPKASKAEPKASKAEPKEPKAEPKEEKPKAARKPQSEEAKAAAKAKRAATLAAKKEAAKSEEDEEVAEEAGEVKPTTKPSKPIKKPTYTLEQLQDFAQMDYEGEIYGVNVRGDVVDDYKYVGRWDEETKTIIKGKKPADWGEVQPGSE
jgi:hypothetical protein